KCSASATRRAAATSATSIIASTSAAPRAACSTITARSSGRRSAARTTFGSREKRSLAAPPPVANFRQIVAVAHDVFAVLDELVAQRLLDVGRARAQAGHPIDHVADQVKTIEIVAHGHVERRGGGALLLVAADVQVVVI